MKTINLTDEQFDTLYEFVDNKVESIVNASVDYNDSEILNEWEDLLDIHTILEETNQWHLLTLTKKNYLTFHTHYSVIVLTQLLSGREV